MNRHRRIPWTIEWSAALFAGVAVFVTIVHFGSRPMPEALAGWLFYVLVCAIYGGIAVGVARGASWVRPLFIGITLLYAVAFLVGPHAMIRRTTPVMWDRGIAATIVIAAAMCFLPPSSRYFRERRRPNQALEPTRGAVTPHAP